MIPAGTYTAKATGSFDFGTAKTGSEQVAVEFEILEGAQSGQCLTWFGYCTEKTQQRTLEALRYAGWQGDDITKLDGLGTRRVSIVVEHESYDGKPARPKIQWVNRFGGAGVKLSDPMDDATRRRFAAKMRTLAKSIAALPAEDPAALQARPGAEHDAVDPPAPDDGDQRDAPPHEDGEDPIPF